MKDFVKNFIHCLAITFACIAVGFGMIFVFLGAMPTVAGTMRPEELVQGLGGWKALKDWAPMILLISTLVASWVAAMKPFTSPRMAMDGNGDIVFVDPIIK